MELNLYRTQVSQPISADTPQGRALPETHPDLLFIDDQTFKVGALSHDEVQWSELEAKALHLLATESKELKLLTPLLQCLQHRNTAEHLVLSLDILSDFILQYWKIAYASGQANKDSLKMRFYQQILQRTQKAMEKLDASLLKEEQRTTLEQSLEQLKASAIKQGLATKLLPTINSLRQSPSKSSTPSASNQQTTPSEQTPASMSALSSADLSIDDSTQRALKQSLINIAKALQKHATGQVLALRVRRFALWSGVNSLPSLHKEETQKATGNTKISQMTAVPKDRVAYYEEQLQQAPDDALWQQLENSLIAAPYWLDGHYLSYRMAQALQYTDAAAAIHQETLSFVARFPDIFHYAFQGGQPFAQDSTQQWLKNGRTPAQSTAQDTLSGDWEHTRQQAMQLAQESGLPAALALLNQGLENAHEPRDRFYWRLLNADVLHANQLGAIATAQYQNLNNQLHDIQVTQWEPALQRRLQQHTLETE